MTPKSSGTSGIRVAKFGGTSVQDRAAIEKVAHIAAAAPNGLVVVLSAMAGVTDLLINAAAAAVRGEEVLADELRRRHLDAAQLVKNAAARRDLEQVIGDSIDEFERICESLATLKEQTQRSLDLVASRGERLLAKIFCAVMQDRGTAAVYVDATELIRVENQYGSLFPDLTATAANAERLLLPPLKQGKLVVVPGYIGTGPDGELVTLGRGGTDLSATVLAHCLAADSVTLYKEVDGLLTADPKHVPEARIVPELHYREAAELAYYGAKVLHPRTIIPLLARQIPLVVRSTFQPHLTGTRIAGDVAPGAFPVKALTAILGQAALAIEGKGMMGVPGIAGRTFSALAQTGISVSVISQASSEASICFVVPEAEAKTATRSLREEFRFEIEHGLIDDVRIVPSQAVLAIVGLGMKGTHGIAARAFAALARAQVNVEAIAQGSSELNISVVIDQKNVRAALASLHREFRLEKLHALPPRPESDAPFAVFGVGQIGRALLRQVQSQRDYFKEKMGLDLPCVGLVDRSGAVLDERGFGDEALAKILLAKEKGLPLLSQATSAPPALPNRLWQLPVKKAIFVDTTAEDSAPLVLEALRAGWHVVLANKKPLAINQKSYDELFATADAVGVALRFEATVGAGLPILDTLAKLRAAGDDIQRIEGCFSGTLGYLMTELSDGAPFSTTVQRAHAMGYTEPDPREDLSGMDVARKALILARTLGIKLELSDLHVTSLFPQDLAGDSPSAFLANLGALDKELEARVLTARKRGEVLRYVARIERNKVAVGIEAVSVDSPLGRLRGTDNTVMITTKRYDRQPLVVSGPGAGADVTAAGVLNDILAIATAEERFSRVKA